MAESAFCVKNISEADKDNTSDCLDINLPASPQALSCKFTAKDDTINEHFLWEDLPTLQVLVVATMVNKTHIESYSCYRLAMWEDAVQCLNLIAKYYVKWTWAIKYNSRLPADHGTAVRANSLHPGKLVASSVFVRVLC